MPSEPSLRGLVFEAKFETPRPDVWARSAEISAPMAAFGLSLGPTPPTPVMAPIAFVSANINAHVGQNGIIVFGSPIAERLEEFGRIASSVATAVADALDLSRFARLGLRTFWTWSLESSDEATAIIRKYLRGSYFRDSRVKLRGISLELADGGLEFTMALGTAFIVENALTSDNGDVPEGAERVLTADLDAFIQEGDPSGNAELLNKEGVSGYFTDATQALRVPHAPGRGTTAHENVGERGSTMVRSL